MNIIDITSRLYLEHVVLLKEYTLRLISLVFKTRIEIF